MKRYTCFQIFPKSPAQVVMPGIKKMVALRKSGISPGICMSMLQDICMGSWMEFIGMEIKSPDLSSCHLEISHQEGTFPHNALFDTNPLSWFYGMCTSLVYILSS